jgi:predicted Zn-dependent protease with MMP-like domain
MTNNEFSNEVKKTLRKLPDEYKDQLDNVEIVIQDWPNETDLENDPNASPFSLLGLYQGIPKTEREAYASLPDKITIFKEPILHAAANDEDAKKIIRDTVLHELGHHFGLSDEELERTEK